MTHHTGPALRWLAPAMATLVLVCVIFNQRQADLGSGSANSAQFLALALSNQSVTAFLAGNPRRDQNSPPAETFEWTNGSGYTSSMHSFSSPKSRN